MNYERFEQLPVWKAAVALATRICALTAKPPFGPQPSLRDQLERAAVAISSHLARGFEAGTTRELLASAAQARASAAEARSMLGLLETLSAGAPLHAEIGELRAQAESLSRQLRAWTGGPQKTSVMGRRASARTRRHAGEVSAEHEEFKEELRRIQRRFATDPGNEP
jgi:four helix bundle protein